MIPVDEFRTENKDIEDLCQILDRVVAELDTAGNAVVRELIDRFIKQVDEHLSHESREAYSELLNNGDAQAHKVAEQFLENTKELHRLCEQNKKHWKQVKSGTGQRSHFGTDFRDLIRLVRERINLENERLFPLVSA